MKIIETDNFAGDYPDEKFLNLPSIREKDKAQAIANAINSATGGPMAPRFWCVVEDDYVLQPGFEP